MAQQLLRYHHRALRILEFATMSAFNSTDKKHAKSETIVSRPLPFKTRNDLQQSIRASVAKTLNHTLADLFDLQSQVKQAHWNVKGPSFFGLHQLFDQIAGSLTEPVDTVAERILALGGFARGTVRMAAEASGLDELPAEFRQEDIVGDIADRVAKAAERARDNIDRTEEAGDKVSADLLTTITALLDKTLYFLEAYQFRGNGKDRE